MEPKHQDQNSKLDLILKKLDKLDIIESKIDEHTEILKSHDDFFIKIINWFVKHDERFDEHDRRFDKIDQRFALQDKRFALQDKKFARIEKMFDTWYSKQTDMENTLVNTKYKSDISYEYRYEHEQKMQVHDRLLAEHEMRVQKLERKTKLFKNSARKPS